MAAAPTPGYVALAPPLSPPSPHGSDESEDNTRRRLFFGDGPDDLEFSAELPVPAGAVARGRRSRGSGVRRRTVAACTGLVLVGLLAMTARFHRGNRSSSLERSGHLSGATNLAETADLWPVARSLVRPPQADTPVVPEIQWPQTPAPAPLPPLATLPPMDPLEPLTTLQPMDPLMMPPLVTVAPLSPSPTLPPLATLAPMTPAPTLPPVATLAPAPFPPAILPSWVPEVPPAPWASTTDDAAAVAAGASSTAAAATVAGAEATTTALPTTAEPSPAAATIAAPTTIAATTEAPAATMTAATLAATMTATTLAVTTTPTATTTPADTTTPAASTTLVATTAPASTDTESRAPSRTTEVSTSSTVIGNTTTEPTTTRAIRTSSVTRTSTTVTTTLIAHICNKEAPVPEEQSALRAWDLPTTTKDVCFRMFSDQTSLTDHGKHTFNRNFCWVMMKKYGCLNHLKDKYTWDKAQETVSRLGGVPSADVSPFRPLEQPELCDRPKPSEGYNWTTAELENASQWFKENVAVYVLNLASQEERWHNITRRLGELSIKNTQIPGFNMTLDEDRDMAYDEGAIPKDFNISRAQLEARLPKNGMGGILGTVGCAAGHFRALGRATAAATRPVTLILEDDAYPDDDFVAQVWSLVQKELPCDWDAVSLGSRCPFGKCISKRLSRVYPDGNEPEWRCRHGVNYGFQGVLYRTASLERLQRKWKPVVFNESRPHCLDVDVALASISDQVSFYAVPSMQALLTEQQDEGGSVRVRLNGGSV